MEFWFRLTSATAGIFSMGPSSGDIAVSVYRSHSSLDVYISSDGSNWDIQSGTVGMSPSDDTWYHCAIVFTGSAYLNFVDGVLEKTTTSSTAIYDGNHSMLMGLDSSGNYSTGYMDEIRISDTARYTEAFTTFGQDGGTIASPTAFTADVNTKLLIHSDWTGGLGADSSGNDNDFTPTNLVATDQVVDSPTNNWCTLNPLDGNSTWSEGNLKVVTPT
jgi:hypothetical protein